ncbi:response regulator transcription factor [Paenibacillus sp. MMS18-CY102]|uniref:response regulator transcription factor n=1 Tax=Paenibacillus sp. MMS18-CY102 TaxID=2682849 RepID=UPI001F318277|nr:response regulator transcription factor [Paenibacillus sp. MMS18-CY102]
MNNNVLCKIIIVDDEILIRQGIKHYLNWEQEGFQIVGEASNGKEALELVEQMQPHIVITDIVMPVMDGEALTRTIKQKYPEIEVIVLSSFGEFHYVRSTFQSGVADYILKPKLDAQELLQVLKRTAAQIPSLQLKPQGEAVELSVTLLMERLIAGYDIDFEPSAINNLFPYSAFVLLGADSKHRPNGSDELKGEQLAGIVDAWWQSARLHLPYHRIVTNQQQLVYVLNGEPEELEETKQLASKMAEELALAHAVPGWVWSDTFTSFAQLGQIFRGSFTKLLNYRFYFPNHRLLTIDKLPEPTAEGNKFDLSQFTEQLKRKQFDLAFQYLEEHVHSMALDYTMDVFAFKSFLSNIIFNVTVLLGNMGYEVKELEERKYAYFKSIDVARQADHAANQLYAFMTEADQCIAARQQPSNVNMGLILAYIDGHYADPITLTEVAKHFHFNPSYLSSYFASHNAYGFSEYLNKVRVEKAAELLSGDTASISEISGMVGYSDHSYFTKVFKKWTGLSPSQYRRQQPNQKRE